MIHPPFFLAYSLEALVKTRARYAREDSLTGSMGFSSSLDHGLLEDKQNGRPKMLEEALPREGSTLQQDLNLLKESESQQISDDVDKQDMMESTAAAVSDNDCQRTQPDALLISNEDRATCLLGGAGADIDQEEMIVRFDDIGAVDSNPMHLSSEVAVASQEMGEREDDEEMEGRGGGEDEEEGGSGDIVIMDDQSDSEEEEDEEEEREGGDEEREREREGGVEEEREGGEGEGEEREGVEKEGHKEEDGGYQSSLSSHAQASSLILYVVLIHVTLCI